MRKSYGMEEKGREGKGVKNKNRCRRSTEDYYHKREVICCLACMNPIRLVDLTGHWREREYRYVPSARLV